MAKNNIEECISIYSGYHVEVFAYKEFLEGLEDAKTQALLNGADKDTIKIGFDICEDEFNIGLVYNRSETKKEQKSRVKLEKKEKDLRKDPEFKKFKQLHKKFGGLW